MDAELNAGIARCVVVFGVSAALVKRAAQGEWQVVDCLGLGVALGTVAELRIPFRCLDRRTHDPVAFMVALIGLVDRKLVTSPRAFAQSTYRHVLFGLVLGRLA